MVSMASILEADDLFLSRITSKQSCEPITHSSRIYYRNSNDKGVPFKWEMKPGKAINQPKDELIPPLCLPPGASPLLLPMSLHRKRSKVPFVFSNLWRKVLMKSKQNKVLFADHRMDSNKIIMSSREASSSGSSSSFSSSVRSNSDDGVITCAPWTYNPVMFCFARRV